MFTPCLKRCLYYVLEHVYTLFETYLHTFEDIFTLRLFFCFQQNNDLLDTPYYNLDKDHENINNTISFRESPIPAPVQFHANPFPLHFHILV